MTACRFIYDNGGRVHAGFKGDAGDCVTRAIAIATGKQYLDVYHDLFDGIREFSQGRSRQAKLIRSKKSGSRGTTPRNGVPKSVSKKYLESLGWVWTPTMFIGSGCKVHLRKNELPSGRIICKVSKHLVAVIDGVIHDTYDCTREGTRCVYGYWSKPS